MILDEYIFLKSLIFHEFRYYFDHVLCTNEILYLQPSLRQWSWFDPQVHDHVLTMYYICTTPCIMYVLCMYYVLMTYDIYSQACANGHGLIRKYMTMYLLCTMYVPCTNKIYLQPSLRQWSWFDPQVRPQSVQTMFQRIRHRHWIQEGNILYCSYSINI
jgi:hypothetical protein